MMAGKMVKLFVAFVFLIYAVLANPTYNQLTNNFNTSSQQRIINGFNARMHYPYLASLRFKPQNMHLCGGAILNQYWILTAAHCIKRVLKNEFMNLKKEQLQIRLGNNSLIYQTDMYDIEKIKMHEGWDGFHLVNDIALLKVSRPIEIDGTKVKSIPIDYELDEENGKAFVCGWGYTHQLSKQPATYLQCLSQVSVPNYKCPVPIPESKICLISPKDSSPYIGDSGSPLVRNYKVIGVVSHGRDEQPLLHPTIYTRVSLYSSWVDNTMNSN